MDRQTDVLNDLAGGVTDPHLLMGWLSLAVMLPPTPPKPPLLRHISTAPPPLSTQAGTQPSSKQELATQLRVWSSAQLDRHISPERALVYQLLAGQVEEVQAALRVDWRRYLGMILW